MKINNDLKRGERIITISYDDMDTLLKREKHITNTVQNVADKRNSEIIESWISITEDKVLLNFKTGYKA